MHKPLSGNLSCLRVLARYRTAYRDEAATDVKGTHEEAEAARVPLGPVLLPLGCFPPAHNRGNLRKAAGHDEGRHRHRRRAHRLIK